MFSTGLRSSTLGATRYGDVAEELKRDGANILIPACPEMKDIVSDASKIGTTDYASTCEKKRG